MNIYIRVDKMDYTVGIENAKIVHWLQYTYFCAVFVPFSAGLRMFRFFGRPIQG
jgi:hypothetical protein